MAALLPLLPGKEQGLARSIPPPIDGPHGRWTVPSHPSRGYSLFWGFPDSPVPTFGLPQVD